LLTRSGMKRLLLVLLIGCGTSTGEDCPDPFNGAFGDAIEGSPCSSTSTCFVEDQFSSCASGFYRCVDGTWHFDHGLGATDGGSCTDSPLDSCSYEGNPGCDTLPTAESCTCGAAGTWHCTCACDDPSRSTCI